MHAFSVLMKDSIEQVTCRVNRSLQAACPFADMTCDFSNQNVFECSVSLEALF